MCVCNHCCFCVNLRRGINILSALIISLCCVNILLAIIKASVLDHFSTPHCFLLIANVSVIGAISYIIRYVNQGREYSWTVSSALFLFVMGQMVSVIDIITNYEIFTIYLMICNGILAGILFYYILVVMSYFQRLTEEVEFSDV